MLRLRSFSELFSSVEKNKPEPQAGGKEAVNHQTAISAGLFFKGRLLYSDIVVLSSKESQTKPCRI
jgi:hypothetical protein